VQAPEERQTGRRLPFQEHQHHRKIWRFYPSIQRFIVFKHLPIADSLLAHQQNEGVSLRDFLGQRS
jgi:hypothetical protein